MNEEVYQALVDLKEHGRTAALCTVVKTRGSTPRKEGSKMLVYPDRSIVGSVGGGEMESRVIDGALDVLESGTPEILCYDLIDPKKDDPGVCGGTLEVFVEPIFSPLTLLVIGGGHVGREVARLADWLGYRVILNDDREEFCRPEAVPEAHQYICCEIEDLPSRMTIDGRTAVVMATRNMGIDTRGIPGLLEHPLSYLGVISSQRRWRLTEEKLLEAGVSQSQLDPIHAPIGLDISAETPEEIALSILAEVVMVQRGGKGVPLSSYN